MNSPPLSKEEGVRAKSCTAKRTGGFYESRSVSSEDSNELHPVLRNKSHTDPGSGRNSNGSDVVLLTDEAKVEIEKEKTSFSLTSSFSKSKTGQMEKSDSKSSTSSKEKDKDKETEKETSKDKTAALPRKTASFMKWAKNLKGRQKTVLLEDVSFDEEDFSISENSEDVQRDVQIECIEAIPRGSKGSRLTAKLIVQSSNTQKKFSRNYRHFQILQKELEILFPQLKEKTIPWPSKYDVNSLRPNQFAPQLNNYKKNLQEYFNQLIYSHPSLPQSPPFLNFIDPFYSPLYKEISSYENTKEGPLKVNSGGYIGGWNERWIVLIDKCLHCYKNNEGHSIPKFSIPLEFSIVEPLPHSKDSFEIKSIVDDKSHEFKAKDEQDRIEWIKKIRTCKSPKLYKGRVHQILTQVSDILVQSVYYGENSSDPFSFDEEKEESSLFFSESPRIRGEVKKENGENPEKPKEEVLQTETKETEANWEEEGPKNLRRKLSISPGGVISNSLDPSISSFKDRLGFLETSVENDRIKRETEKETNKEETKDKSPTISQKGKEPSFNSISSSSDSNVIMNVEKNRIRAAPKEVLLEKLNEEQQDMDFVLCFLLTYRSFITPEILITTCIQRFTSLNAAKASDEKMNPIQLRICTVLAKWIDMNITDFDDQISQILIDFISEQLETNQKYKILAKKIRDAIKKRVMSGKKPSHTKLPKLELPYAFDGHFDVFDISSLEIARQMTLIEFGMFRKISPQECLNIKEKDKSSPNLTAITARFNNVSAWVQLSILKAPDPKSRAAFLSKFIEIASSCVNLNNFNSAMEIMAAVNSTPVFRLRKTWPLLAPSTFSTFQSLQKLLTSERGYRVYRDTIHTIQPPCVPYLGIYLTDLIFVEEGNPTFMENGWINFEKNYLFYRTIKEITLYQQTEYFFETEPQIREFLLQTSNEGLDEDAIYDLSLLVEPKETKTGT